MRRLTQALAVAGFFVALAVFAPQKAEAQPVSPMVCQSYSGTPYMCVHNGAAFPIVGIEAITGNVFNPNAWIAIPGGMIPPGATWRVRFPVWSGGCWQNVFVKTSSGVTHMFGHIDVCHSSSLMITGW